MPATPPVANADGSRAASGAVFSLVGGLPASGLARKVRSLTVLPYGSNGKPQVWNLSAKRCTSKHPCSTTIRYKDNPTFFVRSFDKKNGAGKLLSTTIVTGTRVGLTLIPSVKEATVTATDAMPVFGKAEQIFLAGVGLDAYEDYIIGPAPYDHTIDLRVKGGMAITSRKVTSAVQPVALTYDGGYQYASVSIRNFRTPPSFSRSIVIRPQLSTVVQSTLLQPTGQLATGSDGNVWFADGANCALVKIASDVTTTPYPVPTGIACPYSVTSGPDGNVWFSSPLAPDVSHPGNTGIGYITPAGAVTAFPSSSNADFGPITVGSDGKLWVVDAFNGNIYSSTTSGSMTQAAYGLGVPDTTDIIAGPDGNLWIPVYRPYDSAFAVVSTAGAFVANYGTNVKAPGIAYGGNVYAIAQANPASKAQIGRWNAAGQLTATYSPASGQLEVSQFAVGNDGSIWFSAGTTGYPNTYLVLGRISSSGAYSEVSVTAPTTSGFPAIAGMAFGGDGNLYYTATTPPLIGKVVVPTAAP